MNDKKSVLIFSGLTGTNFLKEGAKNQNLIVLMENFEITVIKFTLAVPLEKMNLL